VFGIIDLGFGIYATSAVTDAARSAGRTAIVNQTVGDIRARAASQATALALPSSDPGSCPALGGAPSAGSGVCVAFVTPDLGSTCPTPVTLGCVAVVTVKYTFTPITPIVGSIIGSVPLSSTARQPIESVCAGVGCPVP
jgi:Flp pilus assembly protein TadG